MESRLHRNNYLLRRVAEFAQKNNITIKSSTFATSDKRHIQTVQTATMQQWLQKRIPMEILCRLHKITSAADNKCQNIYNNNKDFELEFMAYHEEVLTSNNIKQQ